MVDALSSKQHLLALLETKKLGYEMIKEHYAKDLDSKEIYHNFLGGPNGTYNMQQEFLFHGNKLYIPKISLRIVLVREVHEGIRGHFEIQKTLGHACTKLLLAKNA